MGAIVLSQWRFSYREKAHESRKKIIFPTLEAALRGSRFGDSIDSA